MLKFSHITLRPPNGKATIILCKYTLKSHNPQTILCVFLQKEQILTFYIPIIRKYSRNTHKQNDFGK